MANSGERPWARETGCSAGRDDEGAGGGGAVGAVEAVGGVVQAARSSAVAPASEARARRNVRRMVKAADRGV